MSWVVKGFITQAKGFEIKWARRVALTTREKTCKVLVEKIKSWGNILQN
jgi:hypothetical protein